MQPFYYEICFLLMQHLKYFVLLVLVTVASCTNHSIKQSKTSKMEPIKNENAVFSKTDTAKVELSNEEWKKILPEEVFNIARQKGTERAFTGKYWNSKEAGTYYCTACGNPLFNSNGKFESNCGWPSFFEPISKGSIIYAPDNSHGMQRTEVICGKCKAHLGHVFEDGPLPTGLRYYINYVILDFEKAIEDEKGFDKKGE